MSQDQALWALTSLFNPAASQRRVANYRRFRAALPVPLATVELGFDGRFDLAEHDADLYLRVRDGAVLWQKERLLNLLLARLPRTCRYVAWLDSDVLFQDGEWPRQACATLQVQPLVQLFSRVRYLERDADDGTLCVDGLAAAVRRGQAPAALLGRVTERSGGAVAPGFAWAARREVLQRHGLYDACVIGGGDTAFACAAYGVPDLAMQLHRMNTPQRERYARWAGALHHEVRGEVGALPGELRHLWHGDLADRRAGQRHADLEPHQFDPFTDIAPGADGAWRWASDKPALHALLRTYFQRRNDDGAAA